jgi:3-isopropylmalate dehydrogenase
MNHAAMRIAVLPGDGIGPEVVAEGLRALDATAARFGHTIEYEHALIGGAAIDATGSALPDETLHICRSADAVLLGAVGGPKWDDPAASVRPEMGLLGVRKALGLFANLRPVTVHPALMASSPLKPERLAGVDILLIRELTGGLYFGERGRAPLDDGSGGERAFDTCVYTTAEIERVVRMAGTLARTRRGTVTSVDKANVLTTSRLWRNVATRVMRDEFPDIALDHQLVDACAMHLIRNPAHYDVIVTENTFGDILSDEASVLAGSMGMLPSASLGTGRRGLYEPIHGTAPDIAGQGIANPTGTILSVALMLRHSFGLDEEARAIEAAVYTVLDGDCLTPDLARPGVARGTTREMGQAVVTALTR